MGAAEAASARKERPAASRRQGFRLTNALVGIALIASLFGFMASVAWGERQALRALVAAHQSMSQTSRDIGSRSGAEKGTSQNRFLQAPDPEELVEAVDAVATRGLRLDCVAVLVTLGMGGLLLSVTGRRHRRGFRIRPPRRDETCAAEPSALDLYEIARQTKRMLEMTEATAHVGHWRIDRSSAAMFWSDEMFRIYGYEPGSIEANRTLARSAYHPDDRDRVVNEITAGLEGARDIEFRARLIRTDGDVRHVLVRGSHLGGDERSIFGVIVDETEQVRAETRLRENAERLGLALGAGRMFVWERDIASNWVTCSDNATIVIGLREGHIEEFHARIHKDDRARLRDAANAAIRDGSLLVIDYRVTLPDGAIAWRRDEGRLLWEGGRPRFVGLCTDITDLKTAEAALRTSEERLALALDSGSDGLWDWTLTTGDSWFSARWFTMLGYEPGELKGHASTWEALVHPDDKAEVMRRTAEHLEGRTPDYRSEFRLRTKSGAYAWVLSRGRVAQRDEHGRPLRIIGIHIDIGERKAADERIAHLARHDPLTDLPNRALFHERLEQKLSELQRTNGQLTIFCLDLDRFKAINDTLGHAAGDTLLRDVALRLRSCVRTEDTVARLGGDEFAILYVGGADPVNEAALLAARLIAAVEPPVNLDGKSARVGISIGIALAPADGKEGDKLFKCADLALYRAKNDGRNTFRFFEPRMDDEVEERRCLEALLRNALATGEFSLHYQPIVEAKTTTIIGFEALLRWTSVERGPISPTVFIPLAEESGLIVPIGRWVLQAACAEAARWPDHLKVAVNISPVQFRRPELVEDVFSALAMAGLQARRLEVEATESMLLDSNDDLLHTMQNLRTLGVKIALDDFGTGYSSLSYLCRFPFDRIKIDRSFVAGLEDPNSAAIINAVIGLGRQFGMSVTAEGVETEEQLEALRSAGCAELQGYYFSRPCAAADLPALLASRLVSAAA